MLGTAAKSETIVKRGTQEGTESVSAVLDVYWVF